MHDTLTTLPELLLDLTVSLRQAADKAERAALALARPMPQVSTNGKHGLEIDRHALTVRWNGNGCFLGYTLAFRLIDRLAQRPNYYFSHAQLLDDVWGGPRSRSAIRSVVSDLRIRLASAGMAELASMIDGSNPGHYGLLMQRRP